MRVNLKKGENKLRLRYPITTIEGQSLRIQSCSVRWSVFNVRKDSNDKFTNDGSEVTVPQGYYTFTTLKTFLASESITISKNADGTISIDADKDLNLKKFGKLLGFTEDKSISKNTKTKGKYLSSFGVELSEIDIHCSLVDFIRNTDSKGNPSEFLLSIPVDTNQPLFGSITHYDFQGLKIPCAKYYGHDIVFKVFSSKESMEYDYTIYLRMSIEE